jgi:predicted enzyme related to lactoylglutathione lyase
VTARITEIVVDSADPHRLAQFWAEVLGWVVTDSDDHDVEIRPESTDARTSIVPSLLFQRVPEGKTAKNRLHLDVNGFDADQEAELARLLALGATHADIGQGEQRWYVLADPEGNEFCLLRSRVEPGT